MAKKTETNKEKLPNEVVEDENEGTKETATNEEEVKKVEKIEFRTQEGKNFSGFLHPKNRKLVTVDKDGKIFVDESDQQAIDILTRAADVFKV